jgi:hypothetical protein
MTDNFEIGRLMAHLRAPLFATIILVLASCNSTDPFIPDSSVDPSPVGGDGGSSAAPAEEPSFSTSFSGGIAIGLFHQPSSTMGTRYNGSLSNIYPNSLLSELKAIKDRGGKVMLNLAGAPSRYTDGSGNFSLTKWKASVARFRNVNFSSYIKDGTVIGNFLIDEPTNVNRWGMKISASTLEGMARYSKSLWSGLATAVRTRPDNLGSSHYYLDAAWSQYHSRFGDPYKFVQHDAAVAKSKGLALVIGMNVMHGNAGNKMTASQVKSWGGALLSSSYPCAFLSWTYNSTYLSTTSIKDAMSYLRSKAQNRSIKSCRG